jgi:hypothetical protein
MSLNDIATVTISVDTAGIQQVGFGTLCCAAYHTKNTDYTRVYTELSQLVTDGFVAKDPAYRMVARAFQANPRPDRVKLGRLATAYTQVTKLTPTGNPNSTVFEIDLESGTSGVLSAIYTSDSSATLAEVCIGIAAAINALAITGLTAASAGTNTYVTVTMTAGLLCYFSGWDTSLIHLEDVTPDPGIANDLDAIQNRDSDWYGLAVDCNSKPVLQAAAAWVETQTKMLACNTSDWTAYTSGQTTDIGNTLKGLTYARTLTVATKDHTDTYAGVAVLAERLPHDVADGFGGGTWAFKPLVGVPVESWTPTEVTNLRAKNYETYVTTAGQARTLDGKTASGEFADITRGIDWLKIRTQERIVQAQFANQKIPFTDKGGSVMFSCLDAQLSEGTTGGLLSDDPSYSITVPKVSTISSTNRANRKFTGLKFKATLAGAIHLTEITGSVGV